MEHLNSFSEVMGSVRSSRHMLPMCRNPGTLSILACLCSNAEGNLVSQTGVMTRPTAI